MTYYTPAKSYQSAFAHGRQPRLVSVYCADYHHLDQTRVMHLHHDCCELHFLMRGEAHHLINGVDYHLKAGDVAIYNAGVLHEEYIEVTPDIVVYTVVVDHLCWPGMPDNHHIRPDVSPVLAAGDDVPLVTALCQGIYEQTLGDQKTGAELAHHLMTALLLLTVNWPWQQLTAGDLDVQSNGAKIQAWLDAHYSESITLKEMSDALHLNMYYIVHVFKTYTGYAPMQYVSRRRIGESQSLLLHTRMNISDIATTVGYNSNSLFTRTFKRVVGCAPVDYRKKFQSAARRTGELPPESATCRKI